MELREKIQRALEVMNKVIPLYKNPVVMSSFGKDSMVMLELVRQTGRKLPVLFHREPFMPKKYLFANKVIEFNNYAVYDYAPAGTSIIKANGKMEIINWYSVGEKYSYLPVPVVEPKQGEDFLCGLNDLYKKPTSPKFSFPWELVLIGHKSTDIDHIFGEVPLNVDLKQNIGGPDYLFPLRHFTDEDIATFHEMFKIPYNELRYEIKDKKLVEKEDITYNNDYHPACTRCIDRDGPVTVFCPLLKMQISNIGNELNYEEANKPAYLQ